MGSRAVVNGRAVPELRWLWNVLQTGALFTPDGSEARIPRRSQSPPNRHGMAHLLGRRCAGCSEMDDKQQEIDLDAALTALIEALCDAVLNQLETKEIENDQG